MDIKQQLVSRYERLIQQNDETLAMLRSGKITSHADHGSGRRDTTAESIEMFERMNAELRSVLKWAEENWAEVLPR